MVKKKINAHMFSQHIGEKYWVPWNVTHKAQRDKEGGRSTSNRIIDSNENWEQKVRTFFTSTYSVFLNKPQVFVTWAAV